MTTTIEVFKATPDDHIDYLSLLARCEILQRGCAGDIQADDVVQDTLLRAVNALEQFRGKTVGEFKCWLRKILSNALWATMKKARQRREISLSVIVESVEESSRRLDIFVASQTSPSQAASRKEQIDRVLCILAALPVNWGTAVYLAHCADWPVKQIAREMSTTEAAAAGFLRRGMKRLRDKLSAE